MKLLISALVLSVCFCLAGACAHPSGGAKPAEISGNPESVKLTAEEAYEKITSGEPVVILDVRTAEEYEQSHIEGAVLLPNEQIGDSAPPELPVLDAQILIYCRSGNRSAQAAKKLVALGYTNVADFGGINDWPYGTVSGVWETKLGTFGSFRASDIYGGARDESVFSDHKLTMVNIWTTFCGPCLDEMPELAALGREYEKSGVRIVGIVLDTLMPDGSISMSQVKRARELVEITGADYLHLLPSDDLISAKLADVNPVPETVFVDSSGNVVGRSYLGSRSGEEWTKIIDELLEDAAS